MKSFLMKSCIKRLCSACWNLFEEHTFENQNFDTIIGILMNTTDKTFNEYMYAMDWSVRPYQQFIIIPGNFAKLKVS